jgi:hypothetical protein
MNAGNTETCFIRSLFAPSRFGVGSRQHKTVCGADSGSPGRKETAQRLFEQKDSARQAATKVIGEKQIKQRGWLEGAGMHGVRR